MNKKRIFSAIMAVVMVLTMVPIITLAAPSASQISTRLNNMRAMWPTGTLRSDLNYFHPGTIVRRELGGIRCTPLCVWPGWQCHAYAKDVYFRIFGACAGHALMHHDVNRLRIGDYVRYKISSFNHSIVITDIKGDDIWYTDANMGAALWNNNDRNDVRWDVYVSRATLAGWLNQPLPLTDRGQAHPRGYILTYPGNNVTSLSEPTPPTGQPGTITIPGTNLTGNRDHNFSWGAVTDATHYDYQIRHVSNSALNQTRVNSATGRTSHPIRLPNVTNPETFVLRVWPRNSAGPGTSHRDSAPFTVHPPYAVTYLDWNGIELKFDDKVPYGGNSTPPIVNRRHGWVFQRFEPDGAHRNVTENRTLTAIYTRDVFNVRFIDFDGRPIGSVQRIEYESAASPPPPPPVNNFEFIEWSTNEWEYVEKDLNVHAVYQWANYEIPFEVEFHNGINPVNPTRAADGRSYNIPVRITNHHTEDPLLGRIIVAIKTQEGKLVSSSIIPFAPIAHNGGTHVQSIPVLTTALGTVAEVSVIDVQGDGNSSRPLSTTVSSPIQVSDIWSDWSTEDPPSNATDTQDGIEFRTRERLTATSSNPVRDGWTLIGDPVPVYGNTWTTWSTTRPANQLHRQFDERDRAIMTTQWNYWGFANASRSWFHFCSNVSGYSRIETGWRNSQIGHTSSGFSGPQSCGCHGTFTGWYPDGGLRYFYQDTRQVQTGTVKEHRARDPISFNYTHEQWQNWTDWQIGTPPAATTNREVEQRAVTRYLVNEMEDTFYNYKRYSFENLRTGQISYDYTSEWADSMGFQGEWEESRVNESRPFVRTLPEGVTVYGSAADPWFRADVNNEGNRTVYETTESREDNSGTVHRVTGRIENAPDKKATLLVFHGTNIDPTNNQLVYIAQTTLDGTGGYDFEFIPRFPVGQGGTGDFIVMISLEGTTAPIYIETIEALRPTYTVTFIDEDGTVFATDRVIEGNTAILPENPEKEGYNFIGWSTGVSNIRADMTIVARFVLKEYAVVFIDWNKEDFEIKTFKHGDPITVDDVPTQFGGIFAGWTTLDGNIVDTVTENMVITAKFDPAQYTVVFFDKDGTLINEQTVQFGEEAVTPPAPAAPAGLVFRFWSAHTNFITQDMAIHPVFGFPETVETPVASIDSGIYTAAQTVSLTTATPGAQIYYTTVTMNEESYGFANPFEYDESGKITNGTLYTQPITISKDTILAYIAIATGKNDSDLGLSSYIIDPNWTGIPVLCEGGCTPKEENCTECSVCNAKGLMRTCTVQNPCKFHVCILCGKDESLCVCLPISNIIGSFASGLVSAKIFLPEGSELTLGNGMFVPAGDVEPDNLKLVVNQMPVKKPEDFFDALLKYLNET
jgi:hypothetical protein